MYPLINVLTVIISSPSAQSFTSLTQSSNWLSVTANWAFMDSRFCNCLCSAFAVYNDKQTIRDEKQKFSPQLQMLLTWNIKHLKKHHWCHYLLVSVTQWDGQILKLLLIPAHGHESQHVCASCKHRKYHVTITILTYYTYDLTSAVCDHLTCFWHMLGGHCNPGEEGITLFHLLPECWTSSFLICPTPFHLVKIKETTIQRSCWHSYAGNQINWFYHMVIFIYLTLEIMGFGMKYGEERLHVKKVLELWTAFRYSLEIGPIFACHIHTKKGDLPTGQLFLQVQGISKNFSPVHI